MRELKFDIPKARKLADDFLDFCEPGDKEFYRIGMTLRAACNEIEFLKADRAKLMAIAEIAKRRKDLWRDCWCDDSCYCDVHKKFDEDLDKAVAALEAE
jgi:hypothetical protein